MVLAVPATKWGAEGIYVELGTNRSSWWSQLGSGVAGVCADDNLGGHRSSGEGELRARVCGEVRGVHGWTQRSVVSALDTVRWPEDGREHVGDEIRGGACG